MGLGLILASTVVILAIVVPWSSLQDHPHWARIGWIPFVSPPIRRFDVVANVLLFAPLGIGAAWRFERGVAAAAALALAISVLAETVQIYSHSRFPSATDVVCNVMGATAAAVIVRRRMRRGEAQPVLSNGRSRIMKGQ